MSVYIVTGKLGNGKTLVTVGRIRDALRAGKRVATNLDINLKEMFSKEAKEIQFLRIPDKPNIQDLESIGQGYFGPYDESKFGLLVLDECGTWFNSRNWQDKTRKAVNDWFLHSRKFRWDVLIIIQDESMLDSQARDAIGEMLVKCRRLDNIRIPVLAPIVKLLTGFNLTFPRVHRAKVTYADGLVSDVWVYRGNDLFTCYQTDQMFIQDYPHSTHSILPPWYTHGRYKKPLTWSRFMRMTRIIWKRFASPVALSTGILLGVAAMVYSNARTIETKIATVPVVAKNSKQSSAAQSSSVKALSVSPNAMAAKVFKQGQRNNPFEGFTFYYVGDLQDGMLFEVVNPDKSVLTFKQRDLKAMGFIVLKVNQSVAQIIFDGQLTFAFTKPRRPFIQPINVSNDVAMVNK